jgi:DNA-binding response OmpR family regulator
MARILVVEDDVSLTISLRLALSRAGHEPVIAHTLAHARRLMNELPPDLVLLDLGLPDGDGLDALASWRADQRYLPIIALTARVTPEDRVSGLHSGADDYVTKPFDLPELLARVEAQLRRRTWPPRSDPSGAEGLPAETVELGRLRLSFRTREATCDGSPMTLSDMEFRLLRHLVAHRDAVVTRETLLTEVWGLPASSRTRSIDTFIYRLRRLIEDDPAQPRLLVSARGAGYRLLATPT